MVDQGCCETLETCGAYSSNAWQVMGWKCSVFLLTVGQVCVYVSSHGQRVGLCAAALPGRIVQ